jgi:hypothetical protein
MRAFWNYYFTVNLVNFCFSAMAALISVNAKWLPILFCTAGIPVGILAYNTFFKNQYYFYHNLGYSRQKLAGMTFGFNLVPSLLLLIILLFS